MLADVVGFLVCPHCGGGLIVAGPSVTCSNGHGFDIARQGYVNLLPAGKGTPSGDTAAMVSSRARFLAAGHFEPIARAVAELAVRAVGEGGGAGVADVGAGTGYYLASVLDAMPGSAGLALDASKHALRRAARAHARAGAVACDVWGRLPVRTGSIALVTDVFAPRNAEEFRRILSAQGALIVVTPTDRHLKELIATLGLLSVDESKQDRLDAKLGAAFSREETATHEYTMTLTRGDVADVASMGPSAWHSEARTLSGRIGDLPACVSVTASVDVSLYRPA